MKLVQLIAVIGLSISASLADAHEPAVIVDGSFARGQFNWDRGAQNYFFYRYLPIILEGELHLCGAFAGNGATGTSNKFHKAAMREARMVVNEETVIRGLSYFTWGSRRHLSEELVGQQARCVGTDILTENLNGLDIEIVFREGTYRVRN